MQSKCFKVIVPEALDKKIKQDLNLFKILNTNGTQNKSGFMNLLFEDYIREQKKERTSKKSRELIFNLNKSNTEYYENEELRLLQGGNIADFFRKLLNEYFLKSRQQREKILFYKNYIQIANAIDKKLQIKITIANNIGFLFSPYNFVASPEERNLYLVGINERKEFQPIKLSTISTVDVTKTRVGFTECEKGLLTFSVENQDPFVYDIVELKVRLTVEGQRMYKKIDYNRPKSSCEIMDGDILQIQTSSYHAKLYFFRFGKEAEILEPEFLREEFKQEYKAAFENY